MKKRIAALGLMLMLAFGVFGAFLSPSGISAEAAGAIKYQASAEISGGEIIGGGPEAIYYTRREVDSFILTPETPGGWDSNINCGVTAAGVTTTWYDIFFPDLIPNFTPGVEFMGLWFWSQQTAEVTALYNELNYRMGSGGASGVTYQQYMVGMAAYVLTKGYHIAYDGIRAGNNALTSNYKDIFKDGKLVSLFLDTFNITGSLGVESHDGYDTVYISQYAGAHVMVAYGYQEISYYDENDNMFRKDLYLAVQTGYSCNALIRINSHCILDAALVTDITE